MEILAGIEIIDLALKVGNTLVIADTHIGYEEAINKQGILIPRFQFKGIIERLEKIFKQAKKPIYTFIINGDVKHEFGRISETEWRHTLAMLDFISNHCKEIVIVKGNHDTIIGPIAEKRNIKIVEHYLITNNKKRILIIHGDKFPKRLPKCDVIIIGHQHPAITLREGVRSELYRCFLKGKYKKSKLIVLPAFTLVSEGSDILKEEILTPFLKQNLDDFYVYPVADEVYEFGKVRDVKIM